MGSSRLADMRAQRILQISWSFYSVSVGSLSSVDNDGGLTGSLSVKSHAHGGFFPAVATCFAEE